MIIMVELSLLDKIKTLFNLILSSSLFLILLISIGIVILDICYISRKSRKVKIIYGIISVLVILGLSINYIKELIDIINTVNKNIVMLINFPSLLEYIIIIISSILIMVISICLKKFNKTIRAINIGVIISEVFIFFLILDQISKNNLDLSNKIDIYSNQNLMVLFEISVFIFIIWISVLIIYSIIKKLIKTNSKKDEELPDEEIKNPSIEVKQPIEDLELPKKKIEIVNFYNEPEMPKTIEELRKENINSLKDINIQCNVIDGVFTLEEYKEIKKLLDELKKVK